MLGLHSQQVLQVVVNGIEPSEFLVITLAFSSRTGAFEGHKDIGV
jgi:hypothetical protein